MRDILFKAKIIDNGEWVEGSLVKFSEEHYRIATKEDVDCAYTSNGLYDGWMDEIDKDTICQYTGLTDKNGNKIWENDVFKHYNRVQYYDSISHMLGVIVFDEIHCRFTNKDWINNNIYVLSKDCVYEVIGNIFDNPELLEGGADNE